MLKDLLHFLCSVQPGGTEAQVLIYFFLSCFVAWQQLLQAKQYGKQGKRAFLHDIVTVRNTGTPKMPGSSERP